MPDLHTLKVVLTIISGLCWTIVYIEGLRVGLKDRSYAIPFFALALNIAWEFIHSISGFRERAGLQALINAVWFLLDLAIIYTYFRFGRRYFPKSFPQSWFVAWSVIVLFSAFVIEYAFTRELGNFKGGAYAAFLQNLVMSVLFIDMLASRGSREGQSLLLAVNKWIGTLAPTIQFGLIGDLGFPKGSYLVLVLGGFCSVFDLIYIWLLTRMKQVQRFPPITQIQRAKG